jgi:hypothetical protein
MSSTDIDDPYASSGGCRRGVEGRPVEKESTQLLKCHSRFGFGAKSGETVILPDLRQHNI